MEPTSEPSPSPVEEEINDETEEEVSGESFQDDGEWSEDKADYAVTLYDVGCNIKDIAKAVKMPDSDTRKFLKDYIIKYNCDWCSYEEEMEDEDEKEARERHPVMYILEPSDDELDRKLTGRTSPEDGGAEEPKGKWTRKKTEKICFLHDDGVSYDEIAKQLNLGINGVRKFVKEHRLTPGLWKPWKNPKILTMRVCCFKDDPEEIMVIPRQRPLLVTDYIEKKMGRIPKST